MIPHHDPADCQNMGYAMKFILFMILCLGSLALVFLLSLKGNDEFSWVVPTGETFTFVSSRLNENGAFVADIEKKLFLDDGTGEKKTFIITTVGGPYHDLKAYYNQKLNYFWVTRTRRNNRVQVICAYDLKMNIFFHKLSLAKDDSPVRKAIDKAQTDGDTQLLKCRRVKTPRVIGVRVPGKGQQ